MASPQHTFTPGWKPREPDDRDWRIADVTSGAIFERVSGSDLDKALAALIRSTFTPSSVKAWARVVTQALKDLAPTPTPTPTPLPAPTPIPEPPAPAPDAVVRWDTPTVLDQGDTGHCVGFTGADFLGDAPVLDGGVTNELGHAIYYECKVYDGEPREENGSDLRSLGKALKARGRITGYAFASSVDEIKTWVRTKGPVMMGTTWYDSMFHPNAAGEVKIAGGPAGGHAWSIVGHDPQRSLFIAKNHWGTDWADRGFFYLSEPTLARLLSEQGDAMVAVELPLV